MNGNYLVVAFATLFVLLDCKNAKPYDQKFVAHILIMVLNLAIIFLQSKLNRNDESESDDLYEDFVPDFTLQKNFDKKANYILLIIDMQYDFEAALNSSVQRNICGQIKVAKRNNAPIIVAHYTGCGSLVNRLKKALKGYKSIYHVYHDEDSKADVVAECIHNKKMSFRRIQFCGVNHCACVARTMCDLKNYYKVDKMSFDKYGLNCFCDDYPIHAEKNFYF